MRKHSIVCYFFPPLFLRLHHIFPPPLHCLIDAGQQSQTLPLNAVFQYPTSPSCPPCYHLTPTQVSSVSSPKLWTLFFDSLVSISFAFSEVCWPYSPRLCPVVAPNCFLIISYWFPFLSGKTMPDSEEPMINNSAWDRFFLPPTDSIHRTQPGYRTIPGKLTLRSQWSLCSILGSSLSRGVPWNTGEPVSPAEMVISKSSLIAPSFLPRPSVPGILSPPTQKDKDWVIWFVWDCDDFKVGNPSSAPSLSLRHARVAGPHIDHSDNSFFFEGVKKKSIINNFRVT